MPTRGSIGKFHGRYHLLSQDLWKKYKKESGKDISWTDFKNIILLSIEETKAWVLREPIGFQLPGKNGHIAINRFKTYGAFKTYTNTRTSSGQAILNHNLHTGGYTFRIQWFKSTRRFTDRVVYWHFEASRAFKRSLAAVLKGMRGPMYNTFMQDHFVKVVR